MKKSASIGLMIAILYSSTALLFDAAAQTPPPWDPAAVPPSEHGLIPTYVYREDNRPPEEIFRTGFSAWGTNPDLASHVEGRTSNNRRAGSGGDAGSLFIPTTKSLSWLQNTWARNRIFAGGDSPMRTYIYRIRATGNFFNVYDSLMASARNLPQPERRRLENIALTYQRQAEWVATERILPNQIEWADEYAPEEVPDPARPGQTRMTGNIYHTRTIYNTRTEERPGYFSAQTQASPRPFIFTARTNSTADTFVYPGLFGDSSPASWLLGCVRGHLTKREASDKTQDPNCPDGRYSYIPLGNSQVISPIDNKTYTMVTPWIDKHEVKNTYAQEWFPSNCKIGIEKWVMRITCDTSPPYAQKYAMRISAGGRVNTWIQQNCTFEAEYDKEYVTFTIDRLHLYVINTDYKIVDYHYSVADIFSGTDGWWSNIHITPVYPMIRTANSAPPTTCNFANSDAWMNWKEL
jgi:hypothetical protein